MAQAGGLDGQKTIAEGGEVGVDIVVSDAPTVFGHLAVTNPVIADFESGPVTACEGGEVACVGSIFQRFAGVIVGHFGFRIVAGGIGAAMPGVGFFGMGKKGVVRAIFSAVW
jgi:hypothetical protein